MSDDKKTVFFTGGAGWIGLKTVPMLLDKGYKVRIFDNMFRGDRDAANKLAETGLVDIVDQDVRYGGAVHNAMKGCSYVIHAAADSVNRSQAAPYESMDINVVGSHNVFAAAADHGVERVVFCSSASVYGDPEKLPMHEDDKLNPITPYCITKRTSEDVLAYYGRRSGLSWNALRFFNVYGPGQKLTAYYTSVINHFVARIRNGEPPIIDGKGEQSMDFIHVHDIARGIVAAMESEQDKLAINLGTGIDTTVADLARILIDAVGADVEPIFNPRDVIVSRRAADITRAKEVLGWEPTIKVEDGMTELIRLSN